MEALPEDRFVVPCAKLTAEQIEDYTQRLLQGLDIKDHTKRLKSHKRTFVGTDAIAFLVREGMAEDVQDAIAIGNALMKANVFHEVRDAHAFENKPYLYRFIAHDPEYQAKLSAQSAIEQAPTIDMAPEKLDMIARKVRSGIELKNRTVKMKLEEKVFSGAELVKFLLDHDIAFTVPNAIEIGNTLLKANVFRHLHQELPLVNDNGIYYRFINKITLTLDRDKIRNVMTTLRLGLELKDHSDRLKVYDHSFLGKDCVQFLIERKIANNEEEAVTLGNALINAGYIRHATNSQGFKNKDLIYRLTEKSLDPINDTNEASQKTSMEKRQSFFTLLRAEASLTDGESETDEDADNMSDREENRARKDAIKQLSDTLNRDHTRKTSDGSVTFSPYASSRQGSKQGSKTLSPAAGNARSPTGNGTFSPQKPSSPSLRPMTRLEASKSLPAIPENGNSSKIDQTEAPRARACTTRGCTAGDSVCNIS